MQQTYSVNLSAHLVSYRAWAYQVEKLGRRSVVFLEIGNWVNSTFHLRLILAVDAVNVVSARQRSCLGARQSEARSRQ